MLRKALILTAVLLFGTPAYGHDPSPQELQTEVKKLATLKALQAMQTVLLSFFVTVNGISLGDGMIAMAREKYHEPHRKLREKALRNARTSIEKARTAEFYRILQTAGDDYFNALQASIDAGKGVVPPN